MIENYNEELRKPLAEQVAIFHWVLYHASGESENEVGEFIQYALKQNPALVNEPDCVGMYPLEWAVSWDDTQLVKLLLANNADPTKYSKPQRSKVKSLIELARDNNNIKVLQLLNSTLERKLTFFGPQAVSAPEVPQLPKITFKRS